MLSKKILLSAALVSMAGFVACGDDSSSNSSSSPKELPKSVPTFRDLNNYDCNAERKCKTIVIEDHNDTYECDGVSQWNIVMDGVPSKVCPAENGKKTEGDDNKTPDSSTSNGGSSDSNTGTSTDSGTGTSTDSGTNTDGSSSSTAASTNSGSGAMVSCDISGVMGECIEFAEGTEQATQLAEQCESVLSGTLGTGCP